MFLREGWEGAGKRKGNEGMRTVVGAARGGGRGQETRLVVITPRSEVWRGSASECARTQRPLRRLSSLGDGAGAARPHAHLSALHRPLVADPEASEALSASP